MEHILWRIMHNLRSITALCLLLAKKALNWTEGTKV